ncbi:MAG: ferritin-like domain-containing protein [Bdellovibrionia bacterium]
MSSKIDVKDLLKIEFGPEDRKLQSVLRAAFGANDVVLPRDPLWNARFFSLDNSRLFRSLSEDQQRDITAALSQYLLTEAYAIEKIGMGFTAKMSLLSERLEDRMLYSAFAFDEASHFHMISGYLEEQPRGLENSPFLSFLAKIIEDEDRDVLVVIIQVMLEGWGMSHYRRMFEAATDIGFQDTMKRILKDEARHHGSGLAILARSNLNNVQKKRVTDIMTEMLTMVRMGPQSVVAEVEKVVGGLSREQKAKLFFDLETETQSSERLAILRDLIPPECLFLRDRLDGANLFTPLTASQCAEI